MTGEIPRDCDIAVVGGGLAGGLAVLALAARRPELDVRLIESGAVGGNHIWSFFDSDVAAGDHWLVEPLVEHHWDGYDVAFPALRRGIAMGYNCLSGEGLAAAVAEALPPERLIKARAEQLSPHAVIVEDGTQLSARHVIDARGVGDLAALRCGWQKFVGQVLTVDGGHGLTRPLIMDARVDQRDSYRFLYCLPFDAETLFVEDTYYSDDAVMDVAEVQDRIADYAKVKGWTSFDVTRQEEGWLPVVIAGDFDALWPADDKVARIGVRAGLFHATTGYSLPQAVRMAAALPALVGRGDLGAALRARAAAAWRGERFHRMLSAMLFRAAEPALRYRIFERFYALPEGLIARFYAGRSTAADKMRILSGRPPVALGRALAALAKLDWR